MRDKNLFVPFIENMKECYHESKIHYLVNCNKYSKLLTIIRQICKYNNVCYTTKVIYERSKYSQIYYINMTPTKVL